MIELTASAEQQQTHREQNFIRQYTQMSLEEFCGNIRRMESQGLDGISLFNNVISQGLAPDFIAEDEVQHSRRLERITTEITRRFRQEGLRMVLVAGPSCSGKTTTFAWMPFSDRYWFSTLLMALSNTPMLFPVSVEGSVVISVSVSCLTR